MPEKHVYKICRDSEWRSGEVLRGSADDRRDGFIHLSTAEQVPGTLAKHFAAIPDLVLLRIEVAALGDRLRWEPSRGGALFPHFYGALEARHLHCVGHLPQGPDGRSILPEGWSRDDGEIKPG